MKTSKHIILSFFTLFSITASAQWVSQLSGTSAYLTSVHFTSSDTGYASLESGHVIKTVNGGDTWTMTGTGPGGDLFFINSEKGFGGGSGIQRTMDGGNSWDTAYANPAIHSIENCFFTNNLIGYATGNDFDLGTYVLKTVNGGADWDTIYHVPVGLIYALHFTDPLNGFFGGIVESFIYKTSDGGNTWEGITPDSMDLSPITSFSFPTADTGYAASESTGVYKTTDGGNTWSNSTQPFSPYLFSVFFTTDNHGWVAGGNGISAMSLFETIDGGETWFQSTTGHQTISSLFFPNEFTGYAVGTGGIILKYEDSGSGIVTHSDNSSLSISPNPSSGVFTIQNPDYGKSDIIVLNTIGQVVYSQSNITKPNHTVDISAEDAGMYIVHLTQGSKTYVGKLVVE